MAEVLRIKTGSAKEVVDLTDQLETLIRKTKMQEGLCSLFVTHTTACLTTGEIGEGTERDLLEVVERMVPPIRFRHAHDPSHAWSHMAFFLHSWPIAQHSCVVRKVSFGDMAIGHAR